MGWVVLLELWLFSGCRSQRCVHCARTCCMHGMCTVGGLRKQGELSHSVAPQSVSPWTGSCHPG